MADRHIPPHGRALETVLKSWVRNSSRSTSIRCQLTRSVRNERLQGTIVTCIQTMRSGTGSGVAMERAESRRGKNKSGRKAAKAGPKSRRSSDNTRQQPSSYRRRVEGIWLEAVLFAAAA